MLDFHHLVSYFQRRPRRLFAGTAEHTTGKLQCFVTETTGWNQLMNKPQYVLTIFQLWFVRFLLKVSPLLLLNRVKGVCFLYIR
jgi:hypothetical protein